MLSVFSKQINKNLFNKSILKRNYTKKSFLKLDNHCYNERYIKEIIMNTRNECTLVIANTEQNSIINFGTCQSLDKILKFDLNKNNNRLHMEKFLDELT